MRSTDSSGRPRLGRSPYRRAFPALRHTAFLNTGMASPLATHVADAMTRALADECENGRWGRGRTGALAKAQLACRGELAALLGVRRSDVVLTGSATEAVGIVVASFPWRRGDHVLTSDGEHMGGLSALTAAAERHGLRVESIPARPDTIVDAFESAVTARTRMLVCSEVTWQRGEALPVHALGVAARRRGIFTLIDGAQSVGVGRCDLSRSSVDALAISGHKWLMGPAGTGALVLLPHARAHLIPPQPGYRALEFFDDDSVAWKEGAERLTPPGGSVILAAGLLRAVRWLRSEVTLAVAAARSIGLAQLARETAREAGIEVLTPDKTQSGLTALRLRGRDAAAVVRKLAAEGVIIRATDEPGCVRISTALFNEESDVRRAITALARLNTRS